MTYGGDISGTGTLTKSGASTLTLTGNSTYSGNTTISAAGSRLRGGVEDAFSSASAHTLATGTFLDLFGFDQAIGSLAGTGTVTNAGAAAAILTTGGNDTSTTFSGVIQNNVGVTGLTKVGTGTLTLTGANTYTDATTVSSGTLLGGATDAFAQNSAFTVAFGATLGLNNFSQTIGSLAGAGTVTNGGGSARTLTTGGDNTSTAFSGVIQNGAAGSTALTKAGTGTTTLTGTNTYTGATTVNVGTLQGGADNAFSSGSAHTVAAGAFLDLGGFDQAISSLAGAGTVTNAGVAAATLTTGGATTFSGIIQDGAGLTGLTKVGTGTLTLTGDSTYVGGTTISAGTLQLGSGGTTGSILGDVVDNGILAINRSDAVTFGGLISGTGALTKSGLGTLTLTGDSTYVGGTTISTGTLQLGSGGTTGSVSGNIVDNGTLAVNRSDALTLGGIISGTGAVTKSGAGTLTLTGNNTYTGTTTVSAGTLQLGNGGTTGSVAGSIVDNSALVFNRSDALTYGGVVSGTGTLTQAGTGTTTLTGTNTYTGGTTISDGTLQIGSGGTTGVIAGSIADNSALIFNRSNSLTYGGVVSGTGTLTKVGTGTLTLTGDSTYVGGTTISAGTLQLGNGGTSGSILGDVLDNGVLAVNRSDAVTFGGTISGTGALTKSGASTLTLTGDNTYAGITTVSAGTLQLGDGGTTGTVAGNIVDSGALIFDRSNALTYGGIISGGGTLTQAGTGTTTLTGANTFTGGTTISSGTLQIGNGGTTGSVAGSIADNSALVFNRSNALTYAGVVSGTGTLTQAGTGTTILTGTNTYTGGTTISDGTLQIGGGGTGGSIMGDVLDNGVLAFNRSNNLTYGNVVSGTGSLIKNGAGTLTLTGVNPYTGGTTINAGTLRLGNGGTSGSILGDVVDNGVLAINHSNTLTYGGVISGSGSLTQAGTGTTILTGENTYTGGTTISAGALQIGNGGTTGGIAGTMINNGVLIFDRSDALTYAGAISGTGSLIKNGAGTLTLTGVNPYTGGTTINAGRLVLNNAVVPGPVAAMPTALLTGNGTVGPTTIAGTLAPGESIGTITVVGDLNFVPGSTYEVEVSPTAADRTDVSGTATLGGLVQVIGEPGVYVPNTLYTIVSAGSRIGTFDGLSSNFASSDFLAPMLSYDANNAYFSLTQFASFASAGETPNQIATGGAVETLRFGNPIFDIVLSGTAAQAREAFNALSGEVHATVSGVLVSDSHYVRDALRGRLIQANYTDAPNLTVALAAGGPTSVASRDMNGRMALGAGIDDGATPASGAPPTFWTQGFGSWGEFAGNGNAAAAQRNLGGFVSGMDADIGDGWRAGLATGYMQSNVNVGARASSAAVNSYILGAYSGVIAGPLALRSGVAWTWHAIDSLRSVIFPGFYESESASYNAKTAQLFGEVAYPMLTEHGAVEPFAGLARVNLDTDGFTESGATAALTASGDTENVGYLTLGIRAGTAAQPAGSLQITPHGSLAWQYAFGDTTPAQAFAFASNGIAFGISGVPIAQNSALIEAGLDIDLGPDATLDLSYVGQLAGDLQDNGLRGRLNWRF